MKDYFESLKETILDRFSSPLYGTFISSWLLWNWKIPYVTFFVSEEKLLSLHLGLSKIDYISNHLSSNYCTFSLILPAVSTYVFIYLLPILKNKVLEKKLEFEKKEREIRIKIEDSMLLTKEESDKIKLEKVLLYNEYLLNIEKKDNEINRITSDYQVLTSEFNKLKQICDEKDSEIQAHLNEISRLDSISMVDKNEDNAQERELKDHNENLETNVVSERVDNQFVYPLTDLTLVLNKK